MPKNVICGMLMLLAIHAAGQDSLSVLSLDEVIVESEPYEQFVTGSSTRELESGILYGGNTLSTVLQSQSGVYMKQYGAEGQPSTITFRGTGAGRTAVFWNGIPINSLTLGQTDFSLIPVFSADRVVINYGSGSALLGTDAVGGSIHLMTGVDWKDGVSLTVSQTAGSFGNFTTMAGINIGKNNWYSSTRLIYKTLRNDFEVESPRFDNYPQNNASVQSVGIIQSIGTTITSEDRISLDTWVQWNDRELQPLIDNRNNDDHLEDLNVRLVAKYNRYFNRSDLEVRTAFIRDKQIYNRTSETGTIQYLLASDYNHELGKGFSFRAGFNSQQIWTRVDSYDGDFSENRTDLYGSFKYKKKRLVTTLNARQSISSEYSAPFTPSAGISYALVENSTNVLTVRSMAGRHFKIPTLNDRYWDPGGNPDLNAEKGWTWEAGIDHQWIKGSFGINTNATYYHIEADDWIVWLPNGSVWSPFNVGNVISRGGEFEQELQGHWGEVSWSANWGVFYTRASNQEEVFEGDGTIDEQLPYTPEWTSYVGTTWTWKDLSLFGNLKYTGERFTTDRVTTPALPDFWVLDVGIRYTFLEDFNASFNVYNLTNTNYQYIINRATPGRNYLFTIAYSFNTARHENF